jgi:hypothetical protein
MQLFPSGMLTCQCYHKGAEQGVWGQCDQFQTAVEIDDAFRKQIYETAKPPTAAKKKPVEPAQQSARFETQFILDLIEKTEKANSRFF